MSNVVYAWALYLKGPVYVTSFKPLQIVIAVAMGVMFLDDSLYIGRYDYFNFLVFDSLKHFGSALRL